MRLRADHELFLSYLVLVSALTLAISLGADSVLRPHLLRTIEDDLRRELVLGRSIYDNLEGAPPDSVADLIGSLSGRRVTIITRQGVAIGESAPIVREGPPDEDYRYRPEVRAALDDGNGRAIRASTTLGQDLLYLAAVAERGEVIRIAVPLAEVNAALAGVQRRIFGVGVVAVLLAGCFAFGFSVLVTRPLRRTVEVARALAAGDLSRRVSIRRDDEVGGLGRTLNHLADELQRRLGQLEGERAEMQALIDSMSEGVLAVTETGSLRRANPAAQRMFSLGPRAEGIPPEMVSRRPDFLNLVALALGGETVPPRELVGDGQSLLATAHPLPHGGAVLVFLDISELRRLEGVRKDFVANASHELKTPLTAIRGFSETLLDPDLPPELARRFAEVVKDNADRLQRIVDDLLDLSRLEAGRWRAEPSLVDIADLVNEVWSAESSRGRAKGMVLHLDLAADQRTVWADAGGVRQVFANLFSNAVRYTPPGGTVTVRTRAAPHGREGIRPIFGDYPAVDRWTLVEVSDTGAGISNLHLSRIFERFYRADPARSREDGGTGLGLAIVKHLIESHGGWIDAESQVGAGTTIRFVLPAEPPASVAADLPT